MPDHLDNDEADRLIKKYLAGTCTPEEWAQVEDWYNRVYDMHGEDYQRPDLDRIKKQLDRRVLWRSRRKISLTRYVTAAAILMFLSFGIVWHFQSLDTTPQTELTSRYGDDVLPGRNRATITLADGRVIDLDSATNGLLAQEQGASITKDENGLITYEAQSDGLGARAAAFNTIATPRGGQYRITLPDGTKVWLNAESSLKYPTNFTSGERKVTLEGEAYFEVAPNAKQPFLVQSGSQQVTVLGTQFNVYAYANERTEVTTLVEGTVSVRNAASGKELTIKPNQQVTNNGSDLSMQTVDVQDYTAWKDNYFQFSGTELSDAIRQLERWYDLEVDYATIPEGKLYARINRDRKLSTILFTIEKTSGIKFRIEGRRLTIQQ
jgi:transmembrane sensor